MKDKNSKVQCAHDDASSTVIKPTMNLKWVKKAITDMGGNKCKYEYRLHQMFINIENGDETWELVKGIDEYYL